MMRSTVSRTVGRFKRCCGTDQPLQFTALASDPGRVTSKDTVLWLTNRTTPLQPCARGWMSADSSAGMNLDQWQAEFDYRLCIRSLPSDNPLPELAFHALIDADRNRGSVPRSDTNALYVRSVGINVAGHLTRGDHGLVAFAPAIEDSGLAAAGDALREIAQRVKVAE